jgi:hypothetical protein
MERSSLTRLSRIPVPLKVVLSLTLIVLGTGYLIALYNLYLTYNLTDGQPGMSVNDLKRAFYGNRDNTKLAAKIDGGSMAQFLTRPGDKGKILSWIQDGADLNGYESMVRPILAQNCIRCHNPNGLQRFTPLTNYEQVMTVAQVDRGEPVALWARVAHTHIQSIGIIFLILGGVFSFSSLPERWKITIVAVPFAALLLDFATRYLAKYVPGVVYFMIFTGAVTGLSFGIMMLYSLYDMWLKKD